MPSPFTPEMFRMMGYDVVDNAEKSDGSDDSSGEDSDPECRTLTDTFSHAKLHDDDDDKTGNASPGGAKGPPKFKMMSMIGPDWDEVDRLMAEGEARGEKMNKVQLISDLSTFSESQVVTPPTSRKGKAKDPDPAESTKDHKNCKDCYYCKLKNNINPATGKPIGGKNSALWRAGIGPEPGTAPYYE